MTDVFNVAKFFIKMANADENDTITNLRLNKLLYFAQAWHLVRYDSPLFQDDFEAWNLGPVIPCVYRKYKNYGKNNIDFIAEDYDSDVFCSNELDLLFDVLDYYNKYSTSELVNMTHLKGSPWDNVFGVVHNPKIDKTNIKNFFSQEKSLMHFKASSFVQAEEFPTGSDGIPILPKEWNDDEFDYSTMLD